MLNFNNLNFFFKSAEISWVGQVKANKQIFVDGLKLSFQFAFIVLGTIVKHSWLLHLTL